MTGIEVGVAVIIGVLLGRFLPNRRRGPKPPEPVKPICGCGHHHSFHDPATGKCASLMYVPATAARYSHHEPCTCKQYGGPEPLPEYFAPELTGGGQ